MEVVKGATITPIHLPTSIAGARDRLTAVTLAFREWSRLNHVELSACVVCYETSKALVALLRLESTQKLLLARAETTLRMWLRRAKWATPERLIADVNALERFLLSAALTMDALFREAPEPIPANVVPFRRPVCPR